MKKEIEVKVKVDRFDICMSLLEKEGCTFSDPIEQDDMVFVNYDGDYLQFPHGANYLRIRKTKDGAFFTLKRGSEMDSIERETSISNPEEMRDALLFMGYHEVVQVRKIRTKTKYKQYEVCLDDVEGLGKFIELEKISDEDSALVQQELLDLLKSWGVEIKERVLNGYDTLMYIQHHK
ncbi:MAG: hypothetical protein RL094_97 [Candidatus Parcubacteria bacterium]|jgi:adenylate cyclase class 2